MTVLCCTRPTFYVTHTKHLNMVFFTVLFIRFQLQFQQQQLQWLNSHLHLQCYLSLYIFIRILCLIFYASIGQIMLLPCFILFQMYFLSALNSNPCPASPTFEGILTFKILPIMLYKIMYVRCLYCGYISIVSKNF